MVDYKFVFETREDAYDTLRDMRDILNKKGLVTVADLATLVGCVPNCTDKDYCWATLPRFEVLRDRHGYLLDLPKPMKITARLEEDEKPKVRYVSYKDFYNNKNWRGTASRPQITNVMFHPPATIVFWSDKTKTVVKCDERDVFDAEKGLAMAITKKMLGNNYEYYEVFEKWSSPYCAKEEEPISSNRSCLTCVYTNNPPHMKPCCDCYGSPEHVKYKPAFRDVPKHSSRYPSNIHSYLEKAYKLMTDARETSDYTLVDEAIGYLGEALE